MQTRVLQTPSQKAAHFSRRTAVVIHAVAEPLVKPANPTRHTLCGKSLKEWSVAVKALGTGEQTVLFRKGGIKEPTFRPESKEFILFPTGFHTDQDLLKPGVAERYQAEMGFDPKALMGGTMELPYYAQVTGAWTTHDTSAFNALDEFHVWGQPFLDVRLKWRQKQPVTIMELRVWQLAQPVQVPVTEELFGCFSWVDLSSSAAAYSLQGARPAIDDATYAVKQAALRQKLSGIEVQELAL